MTTTGVRLTQLEQGVNRLATSREPRISAILREGRAQLVAGLLPPEPPPDIAKLEVAARGRGITAEMARGALRVLRWSGSGSMLPPGGVEAEDPVPHEPAPATAPAEVDRALLLQWIDATLARANGHV